MFLTLARWFQERDQASNPSELEASASKIFELHPTQLARPRRSVFRQRRDIYPLALETPASECGGLRRACQMLHIRPVVHS